MASILKRLFRSKKFRRKVLKTATENAVPLVQTVQAVYDAYSSKKTKSHPSETTDQANQFIPEMQVISKSFVDRSKLLSSFSTIAITAGIGANLILISQGVEVLRLIDSRLEGMAASLAAQAALNAQKDFPAYVYQLIRERVLQSSRDPDKSHLFFVYHPDNDWYPGFFSLLEENPIGPNFCGYTKQIDTAFAFMLATRRRIKIHEKRARDQSKHHRPTQLHLLIPAYQPILFLEALKIPEELGDFVVEGRINSGKEFVWMNLPEDQMHYTRDIGRYVPPAQGWFKWALANLGLAQSPPGLGEARVLGTRQGGSQIDK